MSQQSTGSHGPSMWCVSILCDARFSAMTPSSHTCRPSPRRDTRYHLIHLYFRVYYVNINIYIYMGMDIYIHTYRYQSVSPTHPPSHITLYSTQGQASKHSMRSLLPPVTNHHIYMYIYIYRNRSSSVHSSSPCMPDRPLSSLPCLLVC